MPDHGMSTHFPELPITHRCTKICFQDDVEPDVFTAILEILPNDGLQEFAFGGNSLDKSLQ